MIPLVICSGPRVLPIAVEASQYYATAGQAVIVLRPAEARAEDGNFAWTTQIVNDQDLPGYGEVKTFLDSKRDEFVRFNRAPGWYFQQYLKLAVVSAIDAPVVFVSDGDTIFSAALMAEVLAQPAILTTGERYENYDRLARALGLAPPMFSCVANGNFFSNSQLLRDLGTPDGFRDVITRYVLPSRGSMDFSEYQLAGSVQADELPFRPIRLFRRFDLLVGPDDMRSSSRLQGALRRYDAIAFEVAHDRGLVRRVAARACYALGKAW